MKKLQLYILAAVFKAFIPAFAALVLLMAGGICMQLLYEGLDVVRLSGLLWLALAYCVPMVLPSAFLTAVIMAFGRLTADNELTAIRAAGIHLFRAIHPVLWAACGMAMVAAFFQFEAVPRARGAMRALKYEAFKQILLDSAALSWRRSFSFPPTFIQYGDYRGGRMYDVLVVQVEGRRPSTIVTAKSAVIRADERNEAQITFEMNDCQITRFDVREDGMPLAGVSAQAVYSIQASPRSKEVLSRRRYLPLFGLIRESRSLARAVEGQPELRDPKAVRKKREAGRRRIQVSLAGVDKSVRTMTRDYEKYTIEEPRRNNQIVETNTRAIAEARNVLNELKEQLADCTRQLDEIENTGAGRERQETLLKRQSTILARIEANKKETEAMQAELDQARRALQTAAARAARLAEPLAVLRERRQELLAQRAEAYRLTRQARDQEDLREMRVRIHKRLAQALSVLTFALVGIPLGIAASRRSVMIAFGLSFAVVLLVFQPMLIYGAQAAKAGALPVVPAIWAGNALTFAIGAILTVRVLNR